MSNGMYTETRIETPEAPATGYLEESPGVKSSKRFWGTMLLSLGALVLIGVAIASLVWARNDTSAALSAGITLMVAGGSLLGITVFDGLGESIGRFIGTHAGGAS
jgi:hypothetical protein